MSKPLWVCVTCAEDFTRKSSAKRHRDNNQIHNQMPQIVRYVEYLIGRAKGDYPPPTIPPRLHGMKTTRPRTALMLINKISFRAHTMQRSDIPKKFKCVRCKEYFTTASDIEEHNRLRHQRRW
jgi:hypothetical protein